MSKNNKESKRLQEQREKQEKEYLKLLKKKEELENDRDKALEKEKPGTWFAGFGSKHYSEELEKNQKKIEKIELSQPGIANQFKQKSEQKGQKLQDKQLEQEQQRQQKEQKLQEQKQQQALLKQKKEQETAIKKHAVLLNEKTKLELQYNKELKKERGGDKSLVLDSKHYDEKLKDKQQDIDKIAKSQPGIAEQFEQNNKKQQEEMKRELDQQLEIERQKEQKLELKEEKKYDSLKLVQLLDKKKELASKMHKLVTKGEEIKSEINKLQESKEPNQKELKKLDKEMQENALAQSNIHKPQVEINGRIEGRLKLVKDQIKNKSISTKEKESFEKELNSYTKALDKTETIYEKHRDKLFKAVKNIAGDSEQIDKVLVAFVEDKKLKVVTEGIKLVGNQAGTVLPILTSIPFLKREAKKIANVINDPKKLDPTNPPFFLKMMQDPQGQEFFKNNGAAVNALVSSAAPKITKLVLKQLSNLEGTNDKIKSKRKEKGFEDLSFDNLSKYKKELGELKENPNPSAKQTKELKTLEEKIKFLSDLENQKHIADTINSLQRKGINNAYIEKNILPIIQNVTKELLVEDPAKLANIINLASNMAVETDPIKKNEILTEIIKQVDITKIITDKSIVNFLSPENSKDLAKIASTVIENNPGIKKVTDNLGVTPELIKDIVPFAAKIGSIALKNPAIGNTIDAIKNVITDDIPIKLANAKTLTLEQVKKLDDGTVDKLLNIGGTIPDLLINKEVIGIIKSDLPEVLDSHKEAIGTVVSKLMPGLVEVMKTKDKDAIQKIATDNGLDQKAVESIVLFAPAKFLGGVNSKFYASAVNAVLPLVSNIIKVVDENKVQEIYGHVQILTKVPDEKMSGEEVDQLKELQSKALNAIVQEGIKLVSNKKVSKSISKDLAGLFQNEEMQEGLGQIISNAKEYVPALNQLGIDEGLMKNLIPFASNTAGSLLEQTSSVIGLYNAVSGSIFGEDVNKVRKSGYEVGRHMKNLLNPAISGFSAALQYKLPIFLRDNQEGIKNSVGNYYDKNPEFAKKATASGFDKEFAQDLAEVGRLVLIDTAEPLVGVIQGMVKDEQNLAYIFEQVNNLAMAEGTVAKAAGAMSLAGSLFSTIAKNTELKSLLESKLTNILDKNTDQFGAVLDKLMSKTVFGRNMTVKGAEILRVMQKKTPQVMELLSNIDKGKYVGVAISLAKIIIDPKMLGVAATLIGDVARYNYQKNLVSNATRQEECGVEMNGMLADSIKNMPIPKKGDPLPDLGSLLEKHVLPEQKNSLQYSLKNHDLRGLELPQDPLKLENFKVVDFRFNDTQFKGEVSFKGSEIKEVSFKNTKFEKGANFKGSTIDAKSLETLLPAIRKHNGEHPENKITLDGVKITGDISKLSLRDVSLKDADLTEAQTVSKKFFGSENKTDVYHADLTDAKFQEGQKFKNKAHADISNQVEDKSFKKYEDKVLTSLAENVQKNLGKDSMDKNFTIQNLKEQLHQGIDGKDLRSAVESIEKNVKTLAKNIVGEHKKSGTNRPLNLEQISQNLASHVVKNNGTDKKGGMSTGKFDEKKQIEK